MERASVIAEYVLIQLLLGWPLFLLASLVLGTYLRISQRLAWATVLYAVGLAWPFSIVCALLVWRGLWPNRFVELMEVTYIHMPALLATCVVFPIAALWVRSFARPNHTIERDARKSGARPSL